MSIKRSHPKLKTKWDYLLNPAVQSTLTFTAERDEAARKVAHAKTSRLNRIRLPCPFCGKLFRGGAGGLGRHKKACIERK